MGKSHDLATIADDGIASLDIGAGGLTVGTDQLAVDASGRVTMPNQPAFNAYLIANPTANGYSSGGNYSASSAGLGVNSDTLILRHTKINVGGSYSTSTGIFTAPVAGSYFFGFAALPDTSQTSQANTHAEFILNGATGTDAPEMYVDNNIVGVHGATISGTALFHLNVNDTVRIKYNGGMHQRYTSFSGYLIG